MDIFYTQNQNGQSQNNQCNGWFMDFINIASFIVGLMNMDLNITSNDLAESKEAIITDLHEVVEKLDMHLSRQDKYLIEQARRLDHLEDVIYGKMSIGGKESSK